MYSYFFGLVLQYNTNGIRKEFRHILIFSNEAPPMEFLSHKEFHMVTTKEIGGYLRLVACRCTLDNNKNVFLETDTIRPPWRASAAITDTEKAAVRKYKAIKETKNLDLENDQGKLFFMQHLGDMLIYWVAGKNFLDKLYVSQTADG